MVQAANRLTGVDVDLIPPLPPESPGPTINPSRLIPKNWISTDPRLIRHQNNVPETLELVEPTQQLSILGQNILNWIVVYPKGGYTYSYRWTTDPLQHLAKPVRNASAGTLLK